MPGVLARSPEMRTGASIAEHEFVAARDLHLVVRARRTHEPHVFEAAARPDEPHGLLRRELAVCESAVFGCNW